MDISETYIKMCEKAEEIQKLADDCWDEFSIGCWYSSNHVRCKGHFEDWHMAYKYCPVCAKELEITPLYSVCLRFQGDDNIWLPRQDQLQEMVDIDDWITALSRFAIFAFGGKRVINGIPHSVFTMEQLWLAFVMKEKYNKVWNGNEWVKET